jgi:hypothetical protein
MTRDTDTRRARAAGRRRVYAYLAWFAAYAVALYGWLARYALGGWALVAIVAGVAIYAGALIGWWMHTCRERGAARTLRRWRRGVDGP